MANIDEIKRRYSVLEYAKTILNLPVHSAGDRCCSLAPDSHNPTSMVIYDQYWRDFKQGIGGDVIDLCAFARHGGDRGAAIRELGGPSSASTWSASTQNRCAQVQKWHEELRPEDREYLGKRKITDETISRLRLGYNGRLTIPYYKNGYVAYVVSRELGQTVAKYKKDELNGTNENIPWGLHTLDRDKDIPLVIAEGAFDAISFEQEGFKVLSPMGGYFNRYALEQVISICKHNKSVFLCFDSDEAGNRFQVDMSKILFSNNIKFHCGELSESKDVSDYYVAGGDLHALVKKAKAGLDVLASKITDKAELKAFLFRAGRFVDSADMAELFEKIMATKLFSPVWLKEICKRAIQLPSEDTIMKEVAENKNIKYFEALGFYEYSCGAWRRRGDYEIRNYISDAMGATQTNSKVTAILGLLKTECVCTEKMNRKPLFNFRNGTLELNTGKFRDHSPEDMSSLQVDYDYTAGEYAPLWDEFLAAICEQDERKIMLLQEVAGYVLFEDNSLQKCFFLLGDGANGKSVFLEVLTQLFGEGNVSNVEMSGLIEPFQRIGLMNSLLNISSETQSNIKGSESIFKQLVVGDTTNGCYKGKDFIEFKTRTKFITACNEYIKSRDLTSGFLRRICFIKFNAKFVDEPVEGHRHEHKADRNITSKLLQFMPAIFNWAYEGYKVLKDVREFTVTEDQLEVMEGFMREINPIVNFIEDNWYGPDRAEINREYLFSTYTQWCRDNGHHPAGKTTFIRRWKMTMAQMNVPVSEKRSGPVRIYTIN